MGSGLSSANSKKWQGKKREVPPHAESSRILFLLYLIHRTWNVVIEHVDSKSARWRGSHTVPSSGEGLGHRFDSVSLADSDVGSCYSTCNCSYCRLRECAQDCISELTLLEGMANSGGWSDEPVSKDKQRPPIYNPEDYATSLKKWGKKTGGGSLYDMESGQDASKSRTLPSQNSKDFRNPSLGVGEEMTLRQFGTPSELLTKLRADLRLSFPSFVQEFACEPLDGVTLLLELLRNVQLSQSGEGARGPPAVRRRPLLDELACLQCLWSCCTRYPDSVRRLVAGSNCVYTLTVCIMSTVNKSRVLALQLLTKACFPPANGHSMISEALSTLRLRYGEPVRFRFLVGMLQSAGGTGELQAAGLSFINALLISAPTPQRKLYIQAELEQASFDIITLKKMISKLPNANDQVTKEIENYEKQLIDIDTLSEKANEALKEKDDLRHKLDLLEKRVKILQEEKGILLSLEKCLKEKCCELQEEVSSLRSEHGNSNRKKTFVIKKNSLHKNRDESSPPEDEGISSSERSLSPDGDPQRDSMVYEVFNVKNETYDIMRSKRNLHKKMEPAKKIDHKKSSDEEEETTIDEVIQELRNIVNHAESEQYNKMPDAYIDNRSSRCNQTSEINVSVKTLECQKHREEEKDDSVTSTRHSIQITNSSNEYIDENIEEEDEEIKIVPSKILPHPPRKAKSLIHLFVPPADQGLLYKRPDLYDDAFYSSDEGSDSLLSASRCQNQVTKNTSGSSFDFQECRALFNSMTEKEKAENRVKRSRTCSREAKRTSVKRSESFQTSEKGSRQRDYIDSMFYNDSQTSTGKSNLQRSNSKCSRVDEIVNLIESKKLTKSLDRIDEGLNSMVDIVMLAEPKKPSWPYERRQRSCSRTNSDAGKETPVVPVAKLNNRLNSFHQRFDMRSNKSKEEVNKIESQQKFYLPHPKLSTGSYDNHTPSYTSPSFLVKRGHSNAGFYSGTHILRDAPASMTSLVMNGTHSHADLKRTLSPMGTSSSFGIHKVTDMPSGLY
ncbi:LOW QUALITY PROTEIN: multiple wing hairs [Aphomia sociella]